MFPHPEIELLQKAASLAARFHASQLRKDGRTPYIAHPVRVAFVLREAFGCADPVVLAAGLLHDLIEDTPADRDDIAEVAGEEVAALVAVLTKDMRLPEAEREEAYDRQLAAAPWQARLIKLADVYDNLCDSLTSRVAVKIDDKVVRALHLAGDDPELRRASQALRELRDAACG